MSEEIANGIIKKYCLMASFDHRIRQIDGRSIDGSREKIDRLWSEFSFGKSGSELEEPLASDFQLLKNQASLDCGLGLNQADYLLLKEGGLLDERDFTERQMRKFAAADDHSRGSMRMGFNSSQQSPNETGSPKFHHASPPNQQESTGEQRTQDLKQPDNPRLLLVQKKLNFVDLTDSKPEQPLTHTSHNSEEERIYAQQRQGVVTFGKESLLGDQTTSKDALTKSTPPLLAKQQKKDFAEQTTNFKSDFQQDRDTPKSYLRTQRQFDTIPPALEQANFVRKNPRDPRSKWFESNQFLQPEQVQEFEVEEENKTEGKPDSDAFVTQSQAFGKAPEIPAMGSFEQLDIRDLKNQSALHAKTGLELAEQKEAGNCPSSAKTITLLFDGLLIPDRQSHSPDSSSAARTCQQFSPLIIEQRLSCMDYPGNTITPYKEEESSIDVKTDHITYQGSMKGLESQSSKQSDGLNCMLPTSEEKKRVLNNFQYRNQQPIADYLQGTRIFPSQIFPANPLQQMPIIPETQQASDLSLPSKPELVAVEAVPVQNPAAADSHLQDKQMTNSNVQMVALFDSKSQCFVERSPSKSRGSLASELKAGRILSQANDLKSNASPVKYLRTQPNDALLQSDVIDGAQAALKESHVLTKSQVNYGIDIPCAPHGHLHYSSLSQPKKTSPKLFNHPKDFASKDPILNRPPIDSPFPMEPCDESESSSKKITQDHHPNYTKNSKPHCSSSDSNRTPIEVRVSTIKLDHIPNPKASLNEFDSTTPN